MLSCSILNIKLFFVILIYLLTCFIIDTYIPKKIEFGYKKLADRFFLAIITILILVYNNYRAFCPDEVLYALWYLVGYFLTSCCFQIYLIINDKKKVIEEIKDISDNIIL